MKFQRCAKGGITSAEMARTALGATSATVRGQVLPGVSVWDIRTDDGRDVDYVIVPGNVGSADTITAAVRALSAIPASESGAA